MTFFFFFMTLKPRFEPYKSVLALNASRELTAAKLINGAKTASVYVESATICASGFLQVDNVPSWTRSGCRVQGAGFRVQGAGFKVQGSGFRVQGSGCRVQGSGCRV